MKKRITHILSFIVIVCLLVNNCIKFPVTFANADVLSAVSGNENAVSGNESAISGNDAADIVDEENVDTTMPDNDTSVSEEDASGNDTSVSGNDASVSAGDATASNNDVSVSGNDAAEIPDTTPEPTLDPTFMNPDNGLIMSNPMFSMSVSSGDAAMFAIPKSADTQIPATVDEYLALYNEANQREFYISSYAELLYVQELCKDSQVNGFEDVTLIFGTLSGGTVWDIITNGTQTVNDSTVSFEGIGTMENPFRGEIYSSIGNNVFTTNVPLFKYLGDGANVHDLIVSSVNSHAIVAENISGTEILLNNLKLSGTVSNAGGAAGIIAASIDSNSQVTITNVTNTTVDGSVGSISVSGVNAGGIAGTVGDGAVVTLGDGVALGSTDGRISVTGTQSAGGHFGIVSGSSVWNLSDESKIYTSVVGAANDCYSGYFAGKLLNATEAAGLITINSVVADGSTITSLDVKVSGTGNGGGLVGLCESGASVKIPSLTINGNVTMSGGNSGGLIGETNDNSLEIANCIVEAEISGVNAGGIFGKISNGQYILKNIYFPGGIAGTNSGGGLIGNVVTAAVELQGVIDLTRANIWSNNPGKIAGVQDNSLIYFSEIEGILSNGTEQLTAADFWNEIGTHGGVYRNQIGTSSTGKLIGDGTLANVGKIYNTIENFVLQDVADFETLAIALGTDGKYGMLHADGSTLVFSGVTNGDYATLLGAAYTVSPTTTNKVIDISYDKTGIVTLNRNDVEDAAHAFSGSMTGSSADVTIEQNINEKQSRVGVFSTLSGNASFSNLTFTGKIENAIGAGGIAYQTIGTSLTLNGITMNREFSNNDTSGILGGVLAVEANVSNNPPFYLNVDTITLASTIDVGNMNNFSGFITTMSDGVETISMNKIVLGGSISCSDASSQIGGFLGKDWQSVNGKISNVTVLPGTVLNYSTAGQFGGLITKLGTIYERLTLDNVKLANLTVNANSKKDHCALLIQNSTNAVIEVIDYDSSNCIVNNPGPNFDEIVGMTLLDGPYSTGAIVSIHSTTANYPDYHYENKALPSLTYNPDNRYFYDVFQWLEPNGVKEAFFTDNVIDSTREAFLWDIIHYAREGNARTTFKDYFSGIDGIQNMGTGEYYSFANEGETGLLDLSKISFYPVINAGSSSYTGNDVVIKFDAEKPSNWGAYSSTKWGARHYALQGGLFANTNKISINAGGGHITFKGTISNVGLHSGVLVGGTQGAMNGGTFHNITLDNLWIYKYGDTGVNEEMRSGLLIGKILDGSASFDNVKMTNYSSVPCINEISQTHAAAALIGMAGSDTAQNLKLDFHNMVIADDKDGKDAVAKHNGDQLAHASFICQYDYTDDISVNKGYGLYLFSESDNSQGIVTYGEELDFDTEFSDTTKKVFAEGSTAPADLYKPYICNIHSIDKDIEVNPKAGDILMGCGTYEDPYIIENYKQLLTLYRYINKTDSEEEALFKSWKVIATGNDSKFCETKHNVTVVSQTTNADGYITAVEWTGQGTDDARYYGQAGFPTPEQMSQAYYRLESDIDLSSIKAENYKKIAADFVGFGIVYEDDNVKINRPFTGVWLGKGADGVIHTITLPDKSSASTYETYGFIQYAQGAVVKDLIIQTSGATDDTNEEGTTEEGTTTEGETAEDTTTEAEDTTAHIKAVGGAVIAYILGGDNIIDNVTVNVDFTIADVNAIIGGYVGNVQKGGLILRNVSDTALAQFTVNAATDIALEKCELIGAVVGKVEDGYVLYDGTDTTSPLWTNASGTVERGGNEAYPQVPNYYIVNGGALANNGMTVTKTDNKITFTIPNAAALQVLEMALNSDALNVRPSDDANYAGGYTEISRSRKAKYSDIGCTDANTADYIAAASYDNVAGYVNDANANKSFAYPYLYQYMTFKDADSQNLNYYDFLVQYTDGDVTRSFTILNSGKLINGVAYGSQCNLVEGGTYNMSVYGKSFRGLGGLYGNVEYGGAFYGNFDGNGSTINVNMNRTLYGTDKTNSAIANIGLFNVLYARDAEWDAVYGMPYDFKDIDDTDETNVLCAVIRDFTIKGRIALDINTTSGGVHACIGGVVAQVAIDGANMAFEKITLVSTDLVSEKCGGVWNNYQKGVGGIVGYIGKPSYVYISECNLAGTEDDVVTLRGHGVGGLVGYSNAKRLKIVCCSVNWTDMNQPVVDPSNGTHIDNIGGLVGWADSSMNNLICLGTVESPLTVTNTILNSDDRVGGIVGGAKTNVSIQHAKIENITISAWSQVGGVVGSLEDNRVSKIMDVTVHNITARDENLCSGMDTISGMVGKNQHTLLIQDSQVTGTKSEDGAYQCTIHTLSWKARSATNCVGGLIGLHDARNLTIINSYVDTVSLKTDQPESYSQSLSVGGLIGYIKAPVILVTEDENDAIYASNLSISAPLANIRKGEVMAAGGLFGWVTGDGLIAGNTNMYAANYVFSGISAINNTVSGKQAGGAIGYVEGYNTKANIRLQDIKISEGSVSSDYIAGGVFGYLQPSTEGTALDNTIGTYTNAISNMTITGSHAGGLCGYLAMNGPVRFESLQLSGNTIVGQSGDYAAGGLFGTVQGILDKDSTVTIKNTHLINNNTIVAEVASPDVLNQVSVGGMIGQIIGINENPTESGVILCDNFNLAVANKVGVRLSGTTDVQLVTGDGTAFSLTNLTNDNLASITAATDYEALQQLTTDFGYFVGNMIGVTESNITQVYIIRSDDSGGDNKFVTPILAVNPPVIDVGRNGSQSIDAYRQYVHVVYGAEISHAKDANLNLADMKKEVEKTKSKFDTDTLASLLVEYRLNAKSVSDFTQMYRDDYVENFPILVYNVEIDSLQNAMESIVDVMTNVAGLSATDLNSSYLTVSAVPKVYNLTDKTITDPAEGTEASIKISQTANGETVYTSDFFDEIGNNLMTYTELTFSYDLSINGFVPQKTFKINVFVEEPILYNVHMKLMEGKVSDVAALKESSISDETARIIMANDSDYTMLLEYCYSEARKGMDAGVKVEKVFSLTQKDANGNDVPREIPAGTRLMLIDVSNGNQAYYYTVPENMSVSTVKFSQFKNSNGQSYVNRDIRDISDASADGVAYTDLSGHELYETGVEQFILTVLATDATSNVAYTIHNGVEIADVGLASRFYPVDGHPEQTSLLVTAVPGLKIGFDRTDSTKTDISGEISREENMNVKATILVEALDQIYWSEKQNAADGVPLVDSSNSGKYLELALYLRGSNGRVSLPDGTNFSYLLESGEDSSMKVLADAAVLYYYKNVYDSFGADLWCLVSNLTTNTSISAEFELDFSGADLSTISEPNYNAVLELLRTANKDYPTSSSKPLDTYAEQIKANAVQDLGFAIKATNLSQLAINTYPLTNEENIINYKVMFDFNTMLKQFSGSDEDTLLERWAGYDYTVTYQIWKKNSDGVYVKYEGDNIKLEAREGLKELTAGVTTIAESKNGVMTCVYDITEQHLKNGYVEWDCILTNNTADLLTEDGMNALTNYKVVATLTITENGVAAPTTETTSDFFIYTITKLKMDL